MGLSEVPPARHPRRREGDRLLAHPPLLDRLLWREGLQPQTLISEDRGLMARMFGTLAIVGAGLAMLLALLGDDSHPDFWAAVLAVAAGALVIGLVAFIGYRRLSAWFFHLALVAGTAMVTVVGATAAGGDVAYAFCYLWIIFVAFLFFPLWAAAAHAVLAAAAFSGVLLINEHPFETGLLVSAMATFGTTGALVGLLRARIESVADALASEVNTDPVTAVINRRGFDARFRAEAERSLRMRRALSLILCDLDHFKAVNDVLGHEEGDATLRRAAIAIGEAVRASDVVARVGGEEFGVLLPDTAANAALAVAERIRHSTRVEFEGFPVPVTVSCGVAELAADGDPDALFRAADDALYEAKRQGRNRSIVAAASANVIPLRHSAAAG